jgi:hypothetical protein
MTVLEQSQSVPSPTGTYSVSVWSQTSAPNDGMSQAIVSEPNGGGSGLAAFYSPRVSLGFLWTGDDELTVRFPDDLPPPRVDATNDRFGPGGRGRVVYEAVPRHEIERADSGRSRSVVSEAR